MPGCVCLSDDQPPLQACADSVPEDQNAGCGVKPLQPTCFPVRVLLLQAAHPIVRDDLVGKLDLTQTSPKNTELCHWV